MPKSADTASKNLPMLEVKGELKWEEMSFTITSLSLSLLFLTGAGSAPQIGRYQMEVTSRRPNSSDVYVMDTTTGVVKWLDFKDEGKPFEEIN